MLRSLPDERLSPNIAASGMCSCESRSPVLPWHAPDSVELDSCLRRNAAHYWEARP